MPSLNCSRRAAVADIELAPVEHEVSTGAVHYELCCGNLRKYWRI